MLKHIFAIHHTFFFLLRTQIHFIILQLFHYLTLKGPVCQIKLFTEYVRNGA